MTDARSRLAAALADRYRLDREIGAGGMATVYLAEDLKHRRKVALKVLKPDLTAALGAARFVHEIAMTAALQHPHILPLFDSGEADGFLFYVMPFIDGETLRTRLQRETQLPVDDAVRITREVADALDYAHQHGVVHRDIKPENILLVGGHALVADFGIALAVSAAAATRLTETGLSLGTPEYMSPEQATAEKEITARSDVYSLGSVLYEMLAGQPPHTGATAQQIVMKVIAEPAASIAAQRKSVPPNVVAALAKALEKVPADRFGSARDFATALADQHFDGGARPSGAGSVTQARARSGPRSIWRQPVVFGLAALLLASVVMNVVQQRRPAAAALERETVRYAFAGPDSARVTLAPGPWSEAISPDGRVLVYTAAEAPGSSVTTLRVKRIDRLETEIIRGTRHAAQPIFSPDGQWLAFVAEDKLKKVRLDGSAPVTVADGAGGFSGADWTTTNEFVVGATGPFHGLARVSAAGGELVTLTRPDSAKGERDHFWPIALADGRHIVFAIWSGAVASAELAITSLDDGRVTRLGLKGVRPLGVLDGALVYHRADGLLMAAPLDVENRKTRGTPVPVHDPVPLPIASSGDAQVFLSRGGALVSAIHAPAAQLMWVSRDGQRRPVSPDVRDFQGPRLSPAQNRLAVLVGNIGRYDVWIQDLASGTLSRLTTSANVTTVEWKPDGSGVVYADNTGTIWSQAADLSTVASPLVRSLNMVQTVALSPDGRALLAVIWSEQQWAVVRVALDSVAAVRPFGIAHRWTVAPRFSPDGKWVALSSNESGVWEVFVHSFPDAATKLQISTAGGSRPVWSKDGTRIFYIAGGAVVAAQLQVGPQLRVVSRDTLALITGRFRDGLDIAADGERIVAPFRTSDALQLEVAINWLTEFRRKMAANTH